jgi:CxxC-x17-CxxC domain-containing protein
MAFQDKSLQCSDCGTTFTFSAEEQETFASRGYTNEPKRCPSCRQTKRADRQDGGYNRQRQDMFSATCAQCGKDTEVPFKPTEGRPVYCRDCYNKIRPARGR